MNSTIIAVYNFVFTYLCFALILKGHSYFLLIPLKTFVTGYPFQFHSCFRKSSLTSMNKKKYVLNKQLACVTFDYTFSSGYTVILRVAF